MNCGRKTRILCPIHLYNIYGYHGHIFVIFPEEYIYAYFPSNVKWLQLTSVTLTLLESISIVVGSVNTVEMSIIIGVDTAKQSRQYK